MLVVCNSCVPVPPLQSKAIEFLWLDRFWRDNCFQVQLTLLSVTLPGSLPHLLTILYSAISLPLSVLPCKPTHSNLSHDFSSIQPVCAVHPLQPYLCSHPCPHHILCVPPSHFTQECRHTTQPACMIALSQKLSHFLQDRWHKHDFQP